MKKISKATELAIYRAFVLLVRLQVAHLTLALSKNEELLRAEVRHVLDRLSNVGFERENNDDSTFKYTVRTMLCRLQLALGFNDEVLRAEVTYVVAKLWNWVDDFYPSDHEGSWLTPAPKGGVGC